MKRLLWLFLLAPICSLAATHNISPGASAATIQSTIQGSASGDSIVFPAGSWNLSALSSQIGVPCGVTITGPVIASYPYAATATLTGPTNIGGAAQWPLVVGPCSSGGPRTTIQYLEWDGKKPGTNCSSPPYGGGGFIDLNPGTSNVTVQFNQLHGNQANACSPGGSSPGSGENYNAFIYAEGDSGCQFFNNLPCGDTGDYNRGVHDDNIVVQWNTFGATSDGTTVNSDCSNIMNRTQYYGAGYDSNGGECGGILIQESWLNANILNNVFQYQEEPIKFVEGCQQNYTQSGPVPPQGNCLADGSQYFPHTVNIYGNLFNFWHRIAIENQEAPNPTNYFFNVAQNTVDPSFGTWGFSTPSGPVNNVSSNVMWANPSNGPGMTEWWQGGGSPFAGPSGAQASHNLVQFGGPGGPDMQFGFQSGPPASVMQYNNLQNVNGACVPNINNCTNGSYINQEEPASVYPDFTGNTYSQTISSMRSIAPTISPTPSGTYGSPISVTLTDTGLTGNAIGPLGNTTIWYTTDGSQPAPGSSSFCSAILPTTPSTAVPTSVTNTCTITVSPGTTVKALGMWGTRNQPTSYPTNYGFTPSATVSAFYPSGGGSPTVTGISLSLAGGSITVGNSAQIRATCSYSNGTSDDCTFTDAFGNTAGGWVSSNTTVATISTAGVLTARAAGSTNVTAAVGAFSSSPLAVAINAAAPTLTAVALADGGVGSIAIGQTVQSSATAQYNSGAIQTSCTGTADMYGTICSPFSSTSPSVATISSSGLISGVAQGTAGMTVKATNGGTSFTSPPLNITVTSNTPPAATLTGVSASFSGQTSVPIGNSLSGAATCTYSDGTTTNCTTTDAHGTLAGSWVSSSGSVATINSTTGVALGVAVGFTNITVHAGAFTSPIFQLQVTPATTGNILGSNQFDFSGQNFANAFVATYACAPSNPSSVNALNLYLPAGTYPAATPYDVLIVPATSSTTMGSAAICSGTYMTTGTGSDVGWHAISPKGGGCGIIAASSCYWVGDVTPGNGVGQGFSDCDNGTASCTGAPPTHGVGTYHFGFNGVNYGVYTNMPATMTFSGNYQVSAYADLSTPNPTLIGGFLGNLGNVNTLVEGQSIQFAAFCSYSDGTSSQCYPTPDQYGNTAVSFSSSNTSIIMVTAGGLATGVGTGAANVTGTLTSSSTSPWTITVSAPPSQAPPASGGRKRPKK